VAHRVKTFVPPGDTVFLTNDHLDILKGQCHGDFNIESHCRQDFVFLEKKLTLRKKICCAFCSSWPTSRKGCPRSAPTHRHTDTQTHRHTATHIDAHRHTHRHTGTRTHAHLSHTHCLFARTKVRTWQTFEKRFFVQTSCRVVHLLQKATIYRVLL
jgi:hypothetical protein